MPSIGHHAALATMANVLGQLVQLAALPVIALKAAPGAFGLYTLYVGGCAVASLLAGLRYDAAIVVSARAAFARRVAWLVFALGACVALLAAALAPALVRLAAPTLGPQAVTLGALAGVYLFANAAHRVALNWLTRERRFAWVGALQLLVVVLTVALQLGWLQADVDPVLALAAGFAFGQVVSPLLAFCVAGRRRRWLGRLRWRELRAIARRYINFPRYMILYGLNSSLRERFVHVLIGWGAGVAALGHAAMVQRIVGAPHAALHAGVGPVLMSHARGRSRHEVALTAAQLIELLGLLLVPLFVVATFESAVLANTLFGPAWVGMAAVVPWLSLAYLALACTGFVDRLFELYGRQRDALALDLGFSVTVLGAMIACGLAGLGQLMVPVFGITYLAYELLWTWRAFVANELPLAPLRRSVAMIGAQLLLSLLAALLLRAAEPLQLRIAGMAAVTLLVLGVHHHWLGGREMLRHVFHRSGS